MYCYWTRKPTAAPSGSSGVAAPSAAAGHGDDNATPQASDNEDEDEDVEMEMGYSDADSEQRESSDDDLGAEADEDDDQQPKTRGTNAADAYLTVVQHRPRASGASRKVTARASVNTRVHWQRKNSTLVQDGDESHRVPVKFMRRIGQSVVRAEVERYLMHKLADPAHMGSINKLLRAAESRLPPRIEETWVLDKHLPRVEGQTEVSCWDRILLG